MMCCCHQAPDLGGKKEIKNKIAKIIAKITYQRKLGIVSLVILNTVSG